MGAHPQSNDWVVVPELPDLFQRMERKILTMEKLRAKLKKNSGFTLVEMLIVVAIIAILIMVSMPMMSNALEKAREGVDAANERDAKSLALISYLTVTSNTDANYVGIVNGTGGSAYYRVDDTVGTLVQDKPTNGYGQGTKIGDVTEDRNGCVIKVTVTVTDGVESVSTAWEKVGG